MKWEIRAIGVFVTSCLLVSGCGGQSDQEAKTPQDALSNVQKALLAGDSEAFTACFDATKEQVKVLEAMCGFVSAASEFEKAMRSAYGQGSVGSAGKTDLDEMKGDAWLKDVTIEAEGDKATATRKGGKGVWQLVRKDGVWKIDPRGMLARGEEKNDEESRQVVDMFRTMTEAIGQVAKRIGGPGYTAEKINQELAAAITRTAKAEP